MHSGILLGLLLEKSFCSNMLECKVGEAKVGRERQAIWEDKGKNRCSGLLELSRLVFCGGMEWEEGTSYNCASELSRPRKLAPSVQLCFFSFWKVKQEGN